MLASGIHHVSINVDDVDAAVAFYTKVLEFTVADRPDLGFAGAWLEVGGQQVHLLERPLPEPLGQHFALRVDDLESARRAVTSRGGDLGDTTEIPGVCLQAFMFDPSGNRIELNQAL